MNKNYLYKKTVLLVITFILAANIIFTFLNYKIYREYETNFNLKLDSIVSYLNDNYDISKNELIEIIRQEENEASGILDIYGIDLASDDLINANAKLSKQNLIINNILNLTLGLLIVIIYHRYQKNQTNSIKEIENYLKEINKRNYKLNIKSNDEDEISILRNELYKMTITLKEESENLRNDKHKLKLAVEDISHQLKTPLTSITILLDNIIEDKDMDELTRKRFILKAKRKIVYTNNLVQSLLKLARFDTNNVVYNRNDVSVNDLIDIAINNVELLSEISDVKIIKEKFDDFKIYVDKKWQNEAISNILKNAIEHSKSGGEVKISVSNDKLYSTIKITNYGETIDTKDIRHIFERFYRAANSKEDSVGIGLNLAKNIVENDNGLIGVESSDNCTSFTIKYFKS